MQYVFYYKVRSGVEHISYVFSDYDGEEVKEEYGKIGTTEKLIEFIKRNVHSYVSVVFEGFDLEKVTYVLCSIADSVESLSTGHDNVYDLLPIMIKKREK